MENTKFLIMDVDGTITDGKIYMGSNGESHKAFSVKDGYVFKYILEPNNIEPIIITARQSEIVKRRCEELGIEKVYQGKHDKLTVLKDIVGEEGLANCAYFGDDMPDIKCMLPIKDNGGIVGCPSDAVKEIKLIADYVCKSKAGEGALREFVEWLVSEKETESELSNRIEAALSYIKKLDMDNLVSGKYEVNEDFFYLVQEYDTKPVEKCIMESHKKYVDIQYICEGSEIMQIANIGALINSTDYDEEKDVQFWNIPKRTAKVVLNKGSYIVLYPEDGHMVCIQNEEIETVKKIVVKVKVS